MRADANVAWREQRRIDAGALRGEPREGVGGAAVVALVVVGGGDRGNRGCCGACRGAFDATAAHSRAGGARRRASALLRDVQSIGGRKRIAADACAGGAIIRTVCIAIGKAEGTACGGVGPRGLLGVRRGSRTGGGGGRGGSARSRRRCVPRAARPAADANAAGRQGERRGGGGGGADEDNIAVITIVGDTCGEVGLRIRIAVSVAIVGVVVVVMGAVEVRPGERVVGGARRQKAVAVRPPHRAAEAANARESSADASPLRRRRAAGPSAEHKVPVARAVPHRAWRGGLRGGVLRMVAAEKGRGKEMLLVLLVLVLGGGRCRLVGPRCGSVGVAIRSVVGALPKGERLRSRLAAVCLHRRSSSNSSPAAAADGS